MAATENLLCKCWHALRDHKKGCLVAGCHCVKFDLAEPPAQVQPEAVAGIVGGGCYRTI